MFKLYAILIILVLLSAAGYYVNNLQNKLELSIANNTKLTLVNTTNQATISQLQQDLLIQQKLVGELNTSLQKAEESKIVLLQKLQRHDLAKLAIKKPKLIEDRINAATTQVFNDLERITNN